MHFHLRILPYVKEFAGLFGSHVTLLHVVEPGESPGTLRQASVEIDLVRQDLGGAGLRADNRERRGDPAHEILEAAREDKSELIAISTHKAQGASRWALGATTEKVVRSATVPLLIARNL